MKKVITMILLWCMFTNANEPAEEWITYLTEDDGTVHKCKREDYLEMMEFFEMNTKERQFTDYVQWELKDKFKKRMSSLN